MEDITQDLDNSDVSDDEFNDKDRFQENTNELEDELEASFNSSIPHKVSMTEEGYKVDIISDDVSLTFSTNIDIEKDVILTRIPNNVPSPTKSKKGNKRTQNKKFSLEEGKKEIEAKLREMRRSEINQVLLSKKGNQEETLICRSVQC